MNDLYDTIYNTRGEEFHTISLPANYNYIAEMHQPRVTILLLLSV